MGIALFTLSSLFAPLQAFFMGGTGRTQAGSGFTQWPLSSRQSLRAASRPQAEGITGNAGSTCARPAAVAQRVRPLRVVRVVEAQEARACAGRMVISGRMADVCAELDRLAALEAATQTAPARH